MNGEDGQTLKRTITLPQMIFYGLGTTIGGGIYALTGKVAGIAGMYAPVSFLVSAILILISAFSYAEMSTRYPISAGAAQYVRAAFDKRAFTILIGWLLIFTGVVSAALLSSATAGFLHDMTGWPKGVLITALVILIGGIAAWGISESVAMVVTITLIEIGGLLLVVFSAGGALGDFGARLPEMIPPVADIAIWTGIMSGAFLAFYAFIGFEDMVNVAEEVKDVKRTMPLAILTCLFATMVIYLLVIITAILTVAPDELAQSNTPLALIMEKGGSAVPPEVMSVISMLATINGALVQIVMGSRVLYGLSKVGDAPSVFGKVHAFTRTPLESTAVVVALILAFALLLELTMLARVASTIILVIFMAVNASLLKVKLMEDEPPEGTFVIPVWVPVLGTITCVALLITQGLSLL